MLEQRPQRAREKDENWQAAGRMRSEGDWWQSRRGAQSHQKTGTGELRLEALLLSRLSAREHGSVECVGDEDN